MTDLNGKVAMVTAGGPEMVGREQCRRSRSTEHAYANMCQSKASPAIREKLLSLPDAL